MNPTGWNVSFDERATSNPWVASHLADSITVQGEDINRLGAEIRHEQLRRSFDAAAMQTGAAEMTYQVTYNADELTARMAIINAANALPEAQRSRIIRAIYTQPVAHKARRNLRDFLTLSALVPITFGAWVGFVWMMAA